MEFLQRGYKNEVFEDAVRRLKEKGIEVVVHLIVGLPGETKENCLDTARYLSGLPVDGVKFQVLQVLSGTKLAELTKGDPSPVPRISLEEYTDIVKQMLEVLPETVTIHRLTGDPPKKLLISPLWTADKKKVLNYMKKEL